MDDPLAYGFTRERGANVTYANVEREALAILAGINLPT